MARRKARQFSLEDKLRILEAARQPSYSLFQGEYSRNLRFRHGGEMDQVFQRLIDRVRGSLQLKTVCTLFGRRQPRRRPREHGMGGAASQSAHLSMPYAYPRAHGSPPRFPRIRR